jgi:predicted ferric reductase
MVLHYFLQQENRHVLEAHLLLLVVNEFTLSHQLVLYNAQAQGLSIFSSLAAAAAAVSLLAAAVAEEDIFLLLVIIYLVRAV